MIWKGRGSGGAKRLFTQCEKETGEQKIRSTGKERDSENITEGRLKEDSENKHQRSYTRKR